MARAAMEEEFFDAQDKPEPEDTLQQPVDPTDGSVWPIPPSAQAPLAEAVSVSARALHASRAQKMAHSSAHEFAPMHLEPIATCSTPVDGAELATNGRLPCPTAPPNLHGASSGAGIGSAGRLRSRHEHKGCAHGEDPQDGSKGADQPNSMHGPPSPGGEQDACEQSGHRRCQPG